MSEELHAKNLTSFDIFLECLKVKMFLEVETRNMTMLLMEFGGGFGIMDEF